MALGDSVSGEDGILRFSQVMTCEECDTDFDQTFKTEAIDIEQVKEPPMAHCTCPNCGHEWEEEFGGWIQYGYS